MSALVLALAICAGVCIGVVSQADLTKHPGRAWFGVAGSLMVVPGALLSWRAFDIEGLRTFALLMGAVAAVTALVLQRHPITRCSEITSP